MSPRRFQPTGMVAGPVVGSAAFELGGFGLPYLLGGGLLLLFDCVLIFSKLVPDSATPKPSSPIRQLLGLREVRAGMACVALSLASMTFMDPIWELLLTSKPFYLANQQVPPTAHSPTPHTPCPRSSPLPPPAPAPPPPPAAPLASHTASASSSRPRWATKPDPDPDPGGLPAHLQGAHLRAPRPACRPARQADRRGASAALRAGRVRRGLSVDRQVESGPL